MSERDPPDDNSKDGERRTVDVDMPVIDSSVWVVHTRLPDGSRVQKGETIFELESDKATFDYPSPATGTFRCLVEDGANPPWDALLARIVLD